MIKVDCCQLYTNDQSGLLPATHLWSKWTAVSYTPMIKVDYCQLHTDDQSFQDGFNSWVAGMVWLHTLSYNVYSGLIGSVRWAFTSKLRHHGLNSRLDTVGSPVTNNNMRFLAKLKTSKILLPRGNNGCFLNPNVTVFMYTTCVTPLLSCVGVYQHIKIHNKKIISLLYLRTRDLLYVSRNVIFHLDCIYICTLNYKWNIRSTFFCVRNNLIICKT